MTPTPRTDAKQFIGQAEWAEDNAPLLGLVEADFARQLERELGEANQQVDAQSNLVCNIQDTCRSRGFNQRPVDEAVIAMAQERDQLRQQLLATEAAMRVKDEALVQWVAWYHVDPLSGDKHWQELPDIVKQSEKALATTPTNAITPIVEALESVIKELSSISCATYLGSNFENHFRQLFFRVEQLKEPIKKALTLLGQKGS